MSRTRLILIIMLGALTTGAALSEAATAHRWVLKQCEIRTNFLQGRRWLTEPDCKNQVGASEEGKWQHRTALRNFRGTSGVSELESEIASTKITIVCKKDKIEGVFEEEGKTKATITYEECTLVGASGCRVPNIKAKVLDRVIQNEKSEPEDEFFEEENEKKEKVPFATIVIEVCALKSSLNVTGTQTCGLPHIEELLLQHELICKTSGSKLKLGTKTATYKGNAIIDLENGEGETWGEE